MSTPTLSPNQPIVKVHSSRSSEAWQRTLKHSEHSPGAAPTLTSNLSTQAFLISQLPPAWLEQGVWWGLASVRDYTRAVELLKFFSTKNNTNLEPLLFPEDFNRWLASPPTVPRVLLIAPEHITLALAKPAAVEAHTIKLSPGAAINPVSLMRKLVAAGYEPGPLPDRAGWFHSQGGTLTIVSNEQAVRLVFSATLLEQIQSLNLDTGKTGAPITALTLPPHKLPPDAHTTLLHYLTAKLTLVAPPAEFFGVGKDFILNPLVPSTYFETVPLFGKQWDQFELFLGVTQDKKQHVVIYTAQPQTLNPHLPVLPNIDIIEIPERTAAELDGFIDTVGNVVYLTDRELIGVPRRPPRYQLTSLNELTLNDYLVHIDHGIGRFKGLSRLTIDEVTHDYLTVEYAEEDKLYVPVEHTDRLSRYLGSPHPKLERLHSASWFHTTTKVKIETAALARELLSVYARRQSAHVPPWQHYPEEELLANDFPYPLTPDQLKAWAEISTDLDRGVPMDRLVCGDVGFGKTELALRAAFRAVLNHQQVAVLAPTTILAQQHFDTFHDRLNKLGVRVGLVSRSLSPKKTRSTLASIRTGTIDIAIGTHALLGRQVHFPTLGLLVLDEEQRFGVKQKEKLKGLKPNLHVLTLSATPIPRTLHLSVSGIRDMSLIATPPLGRQAVTSTFCPPHDSTIKRAIEHELKRGGQVYYLVNHIHQLPAVETKLRKLLPELTVGIIHGRLPAHEVAETMHKFDEGKLNVLLATSIIENGLDLPNVNTLIVEQAEQFGLSDLYQLRGRVGRGREKAYAYFLTTTKATTGAAKRLEALAHAQQLGSGLTVALKDMELRGAGSILGREQHGQVSAVGLHLYGQLLAQAVAELQTGEPTPTVPEVLLRLPLEARLTAELIPDETNRIQAYQRLANVTEPLELTATAHELLNRPLGDDESDRLLKNLLTILEVKLLAERARLREVSCRTNGQTGQFSLRFLETPPPNILTRLTDFDSRWHRVEGSWQASHPLAAGAWILWLKHSLKLLGK